MQEKQTSGRPASLRALSPPCPPGRQRQSRSISARAQDAPGSQPELEQQRPSASVPTTTMLTVRFQERVASQQTEVNAQALRQRETETEDAHWPEHVQNVQILCLHAPCAGGLSEFIQRKNLLASSLNSSGCRQ